MSDLDLFFKVIKEKVCHHDIYTLTICITLYTFHNNYSDPSDETESQVQRLMTLNYFSRAWRLMKKKNGHHDISTPTICITSIFLPVIHMMKLTVKFKDGP